MSEKLLTEEEREAIERANAGEPPATPENKTSPPAGGPTETPKGNKAKTQKGNSTTAKEKTTASKTVSDTGKTSEAPDSTDPSSADGKPQDVVNVILTKAASFSGRGVSRVKKGVPIPVDQKKAEALLATGLFERA